MRPLRTSLCVLAVVFSASACKDSAGPGISQPQVDSITPVAGAPGVHVTLYGSGFVPGGTAVFFGQAAADSTSVVSASRAMAIVPEGLSDGQFYDVRVANPDGGQTTVREAFRAVLRPRVDSISPSRGTVGTEVRIHGIGFAQDSVEVFFGAQGAEVEFEEGFLYVVAPEGLSAGSAYDIRVVNRAVSADTLAGAFEAVAPDLVRINGVSRPSGIVGMTVIIDGSAFGDRVGLGKVYFRGSDGAPIEASIASAEDWTNTFIVTSVPQGTADSSAVWVETATGVSREIGFHLISSGTFSPSNIHWTVTTELPVALQGLGAEYVPVSDGLQPANYIFAIGGADSSGGARAEVYRARVLPSGALESWQATTPLPGSRAYAATTAATAFTAALDTTTTAAVLYVLGGKDASGTTVSTVLHAQVGLDGALSSWAETTALPLPLHSAGAALFRGFLYVAGGAAAGDTATTAVYRAQVRQDGTLGEWQTMAALPIPRAYHSLVSFGPYLYAVGGETAASAPTASTQTTSETAAVELGRINLRTGGLTSAGWSPLAAMQKGRSKHGAIFAGGTIFVTSGVYSGQPGSSENIYGSVQSDGSVSGWNGATGSQTIAAALGYSLYNQATVSFVDEAGNGRVLVLGGAKRGTSGEPSAAVLYY